MFGRQEVSETGDNSIFSAGWVRGGAETDK